MSNLITLDNVSLALGHDLLLDNAKLTVTAGERVCLIGRNGAGKSSLLKVIDATLPIDSGTVQRKSGLVIARLEQELPQHCTLSVYEYVAEALAETGQLLTAYHKLTQRLADNPSADDMHELERLQQMLEAKNAWQLENSINQILARLNLSADTKVAELSGGWQRRAALAKALVTSPDLLLLDEPTNHLDIEAIQWLEEQLLNSNVGLIFITHDRALLQRLATRIIELDRGKLTSWPGDYANFLQRKQEMLAAEEKQNAEFDKKLAQEERWIRQGIKARRTRNEGRVRALKALRVERKQRREVQGNVSFHVNTAEKSGALVIEAKGITHYYGGRCIINDFSMMIMRGDRVGLIGPNGAGKSTLLNILLGNIEPQSGSVRQGTKLKISYFDQLRAALEPEKTVAENITQGASDFVEVNGSKRHIISYLVDFLFTPQRAMTQVKFLSGGEANRLLLARLFSQPANLIVLDEPTNDLDIETLELLEELLADYQGTLLIVSHDRAFLDNVVTSTLVFEGNGKVQEYIGGYEDWLRQRPTAAAAVSGTGAPKEKKAERAKTFVKLSYKEQRELEQLPERIQQLEKEQAELQQLASTPEFYQQPAETISTTMATLTQLANDLTAAYQRWEELEEKNR